MSLEMGCAVTLLAGAALLRLAAIVYYRFDNDEPQHLHVVWSWTQGLVQYRDVFDNHMPLFHLLSVPLLWLVGVHPTTLFVIDAGPHGYAPGPGDARIAVIWAQAAERGFSPFLADR